MIKNYNWHKLRLFNSISNLLDEVPFQYKQNSQLLKLIWNRIRSLRNISMLFFLMWPITENYKITHEGKFWAYEIPTRKNLGLTKCPREKLWTDEIPTRKYFEPTKYPRWYVSTSLTRPTMACLGTFQNVCFIIFLIFFQDLFFLIFAIFVLFQIRLVFR